MLHKGLFSYGARAEIFTFNEVVCAGALPDDFRVRMEPLLALLVLKPDGGKMLTLEGRRSDVVTWTCVAVTSDESADGYTSGYV